MFHSISSLKMKQFCMIVQMNRKYAVLLIKISLSSIPLDYSPVMLHFSSLLHLRSFDNIAIICHSISNLVFYRSFPIKLWEHSKRCTSPRESKSKSQIFIYIPSSPLPTALCLISKTSSFSCLFV